MFLSKNHYKKSETVLADLTRMYLFYNVVKLYDLRCASHQNVWIFEKNVNEDPPLNAGCMKTYKVERIN